MKLFVLSFALLALTLLGSNSFAKQVDWQKVLAYGYNQLSVGNTDESIKIFSNKVKKYPSSAACHTALGRALKKRGKIDEAKEEFRQATQLESNYPDAFYELGVIEEEDKRWPEASAAFEKYLQLKPDASERQALADRIRFCNDHFLNQSPQQ